MSKLPYCIGGMTPDSWPLAWFYCFREHVNSLESPLTFDSIKVFQKEMRKYSVLPWQMELSFRSTRGWNSRACEIRGWISLNHRSSGIFQTLAGKVPPNKQNRCTLGWWERLKSVWYTDLIECSPLFILNFPVDLHKYATSFCEGDWSEWPVSEF